MKKNLTDQVVKVTMGDRTFDQHIEQIRKEGLYGSPSSFRSFALWSMGLIKPPKTAEIVITFGCYSAFCMQRDILSYVKLLDRLGVEYTWLDKEYCCGSPLLDGALDPDGLQKERARKEATEYLSMNIAAARERGAKNMVHMCIWCAYVGKMLFPNEDVAQLFILDLLVEKLSEANLQVKPATVGYYEGCHLRAHHQTPGVKIDHVPYRELMAAVKGLEMVEIPKHLCCVHEMDRLLDRIDKAKVTTIVSPCPACVLRLRRALVGKVDVKSPQEVLLEALG